MCNMHFKFGKIWWKWNFVQQLPRQIEYQMPIRVHLLGNKLSSLWYVNNINMLLCCLTIWKNSSISMMHCKHSTFNVLTYPEIIPLIYLFLLCYVCVWLISINSEFRCVQKLMSKRPIHFWRRSKRRKRKIDRRTDNAQCSLFIAHCSFNRHLKENPMDFYIF